MRNLKRNTLTLAAFCLLLTGCADTSTGTSSSGTNAVTEKTTEQNTLPGPSESEQSSPSTDPTADSEYTYEELTDGTLKLVKYNGKETDITVPSEIGGKKVTEIGASCFAASISAQIIRVPEGVVKIDDYAFECCEVLKKVYLPSTLKEIGDGAFSGCVDLYLADLQDHVTVIGDGAFMECASLVSMVMPTDLTEIGEFAFAGCSNLVSIQFNGAMNAIPDRLFYNCGELRTVKFPNEGLTSVGKRAFSNCSALTYVYLPETVTEIKPYAFESCSELSSITVPAEVLQDGTFNGCYNLSWIECGKNLKKIEAGALVGTQIETSNLPEGIEIDPNAKIPANANEEESENQNPSEDPESGSSFDGKTGSICTNVPEFDESGFRTVSNEEFADWANSYVSFNAANAQTDFEHTRYIAMYKGEIVPHYMPMVSAMDPNSDYYDEAVSHFGDDFTAMYQMIDHGLSTEMHTFKNPDDLILYSGVYDSQLMAAAHTDHKPSMEELAACVGQTFTDPIMISTTTNFDVACHFSDTLFIIYAKAECMDRLGSVCMDSYMHTVENEILMDCNATYKILDVGVMETPADEEHEAGFVNYVKVELQ